MSDKHHDKINNRQNQEHLINAAFTESVQHSLHNRTCNRLRRAESRNRQARRKTLSVLKPEHQRFDRRQVTCSEADTHDEAIAQINAEQRQHTAFMRAAVIDKKSCARHARRKADRGNQRRLMNILLHNISEKRGRHAEEKDGETKCPFRCTFGKSDVIRDFLAEN